MGEGREEGLAAGCEHLDHDHAGAATREPDHLVADTVTCSTWQQITTCSSPDGYVSHETTWNGITTGDDNQGNRWTTSRWRDIETTTVAPPAR